MEDHTSLGYALASVASIALVANFLLNRGPNLSHIPAIGPTGIFASHTSARNFLKNAQGMLQEGYDKYRGRLFRVPGLDKWIIVVSSTQHINELSAAKEEVLSFNDEIEDFLQAEYTTGREVHHNRYHVDVIRSPLTRNLAVRFADVYDEIDTSFRDLVAPKGDEWAKFPAYYTVAQVVCRTSNRLFVGLPLCRDPDYLALNLQYTGFVVQAAEKIKGYPNFLKPFVGRWLTEISESAKRGTKHLRPILEERLRMRDEYGPDWDEKPNDLIQWLVDGTEDRSIYNFVMRILGINFAAIHTSSASFTFVLYYLAAYPHYLKPLREEADAIVKEDGWTKASVGKMHKIDSFIKEVMRLQGLGAASMTRKARKDFTFSDGQTIPAGATVTVHHRGLHHDEHYYPDPLQFKPFRSSDLRVDGESTKHQLVKTGLDYLVFGHGRSACPGRFFAANELKLMLAYVAMNYDVKFENEGVLPEATWSATSTMPDMAAQVMFRRRQA